MAAISLKEVVTKSKNFQELGGIFASGFDHSFSFWGAREVTVDGFSGTISLDYLSSQFLELFKDSSLDSAAEIRSARDLKERILELDELSDEIIKKAHLLTWLFFTLRKGLNYLGSCLGVRTPCARLSSVVIPSLSPSHFSGRPGISQVSVRGSSHLEEKQPRFLENAERKVPRGTL